MSGEFSPLPGHTRKVMFYQAIIGLVTAPGFLFQGQWQALSALFGALVAIVMAFLLGRRMKRAGNAAVQSTRWAMTLVFIGVVQRFLLVLVLFGVGFGVLKLNPLAAVVGFGLAQLGYLIGARATIDK